METNSIITIFGDICPVSDTLKGFSSGDPKQIMSEEILSMIQNSDFTVGNLECVFIDSPSPILKTGPILHAPVRCMETLFNAGFSAFSLSNNHIRDCGSTGLLSTIESCTSYDILTFGAGENMSEAQLPLLTVINGYKVAFMSFSEQEFNYATESRPGASTFDVYSDLNRISDIKKQVDRLIILYHGGIEYYQYPSPMLQKKCRAMAKAGADVILCQHSHCVGTYEFYNHSFILYGQGNNLFGYKDNNSSWNEGLIIRIELLEDRFSVKLIPCETSRKSRLELMGPSDSEIFLNRIQNRSEKLNDKDEIRNNWKDFCSGMENLNLPLLLGWNRYLIYINRKLNGWPLRLIYGKRKRNITQNLIRCESHYEVIRTILDEYNFK